MGKEGFRCLCRVCRFFERYRSFRSAIIYTVTQIPTDTRIIQDYFGKTIGYTKRVFLTYGPTGKSRGVATIIFSDPKAAAKAAAQLDGVKVDNRAMRVSNV